MCNLKVSLALSIVTRESFGYLNNLHTLLACTTLQPIILPIDTIGHQHITLVLIIDESVTSVKCDT